MDKTTERRNDEMIKTKIALPFAFASIDDNSTASSRKNSRHLNVVQDPP